MSEMKYGYALPRVDPDRERQEGEQIREAPFTYEAYAAMPDDGNRYEIVNGTLQLMSPGPSLPHQSVSSELQHLLNQTCRSDYLIFDAPLDLILSSTDVRQPDLMMVHRSREEILTSRGIEGVPDLIVEILSPGSMRRDRISKGATYSQYGLEEYWIIDPLGEVLEQYLLRNGELRIVEVYEGDMPLKSNKVSSAQFTMNELFAGVVKPKS
ncbi:Uma2 family endonuclease [Paenibacillus sp. GCM10023252]|uniref:Uma2 family endonuclease n=1 Tax=Paenibacillus sp. GCM10023252 TaxID=3252649 RepID=UPI00362316F4